MKSLLSVLISLLISLNFAYASYDAWFAPYPAGFNVNLRNSSIYTGAAAGNIDTSTGKGKAKTWNASGYNDDTLVAVVGVTNMTAEEATNHEIKIGISVKLKGDGWNYVSASEPFLKRPFAFDFVSGNPDGGAGRDMIRMGYGGSKSVENTLELRPAQHHDSGYYEAWGDVVLYLPDVDLSSALSASDYYCGLDLTLYVDGVEKKSWHYTFNGYIDSEPDMNETQVFFNIVPDARANSLDVEDLLVNGETPEIGKYSYETQAFISSDQISDKTELQYDYQSTNDFFIFASASQYADVPDNAGFRMYYEGNRNDKYFNFSIGLVSDDSFSPDHDNDVWFDGTDDMSSFSEPARQILKAARIEEQFGHTQGGSKVLVFRDNGRILIDAEDTYLNNPDRVNNEFNAGVYSSTVYFHVVSLK